MPITIEVNGQHFTNFLSASITKQLDALSNSFSVAVTTTSGNPLPFKGNEECAMYVNGVKQLTGWLEDVDGSYSSDSHDLSFNGRDKTCDIVDSSLEALSDIGEAPTLKSLIERVISQLKLDKTDPPMTVIENTKTAAFNKAEDSIAIENGDNAFDFLQTLSNKRQVLLSSNADGNIVVTQAQAVDSGARLVNVDKSDPNSEQNNVLSSSWNYTTSDRFRTYKASSKLNPIALILSGEVDLDSVVDQSGGAQDDEVRESRQMVFKTTKSSSATQTEERAKWEANIRKARASTYSCIVAGHTLGDDSAEIWEVNTLVHVVDVFAGIDEKMLVNTVTFVSDLQRGSTTELELTDRTAYTTQIEKPVNAPGATGLGIFDFVLNKDKD